MHFTHTHAHTRTHTRVSLVSTQQTSCKAKLHMHFKHTHTYQLCIHSKNVLYKPNLHTHTHTARVNIASTQQTTCKVAHHVSVRAYKTKPTVHIHTHTHRRSSRLSQGGGASPVYAAPPTYARVRGSSGQTTGQMELFDAAKPQLDEPLRRRRDR